MLVEAWQGQGRPTTTSYLVVRGKSALHLAVHCWGFSYSTCSSESRQGPATRDQPWPLLGNIYSFTLLSPCCAALCCPALPLQLCGPHPEPLHALLPPEAEPFMRPEANRPYSVKHASQQASIVGNMRRAGLLQNPRETVYVEFGAGKGYLSSMLADCSGAEKVVMLDRRGFKTKADR